VSEDEPDGPPEDDVGLDRARFWPGTAAADAGHDNLGSAVYGALAERLVRGNFRPNERVRIRELADVLGTSVTPVQDAVLRLVQDRALVMRSPRDIRVPVLTAREYLEIRTIRLELEVLAAEAAAKTATRAQIDDLAALIADNEAALSAGDQDVALELNQAFHLKLAEMADMALLRRILQRLWLQLGPVIAARCPDLSPELVRDHHAVLDAITRGDSPGAADAVRRDIRECRLGILEDIRSAEAGRSSAGEPL